MQTQTKNTTKLNFDFSVFRGYSQQLFDVLNDTEFAQLNEKLKGSTVRIFEKKLQVLMQDIEHIVELDLDEVEDGQLETIVERIGYMQDFVYEEAFDKSIESFVDLYIISDVEDQVKGFRVLQMHLQQLVKVLRSELAAMNYSEFIGRLNSKL